MILKKLIPAWTRERRVEDNFLADNNSHDGKADCPECAASKHPDNKLCQLAFSMEHMRSVEHDADHEAVCAQYDLIRQNRDIYSLAILRRETVKFNAMAQHFLNRLDAYTLKVDIFFGNPDLIRALHVNHTYYLRDTEKMIDEIYAMKKNGRHIATFWMRYRFRFLIWSLYGVLIMGILLIFSVMLKRYYFLF